MYEVVVWYNPNKDSYYYRKYSYIHYCHEIGFKNGYGHEIVLIIDLTGHEKISRKKVIINSLIRFLKKIERG